jgi:hypothetical protein
VAVAAAVTHDAKAIANGMRGTITFVVFRAPRSVTRVGVSDYEEAVWRGIWMSS